MEKELENGNATPFGCSFHRACTWVCAYGGYRIDWN